MTSLIGTDLIGGDAGGGAVDTVNGIAPVGGDVSLVASDIPSTGPSTVQADLDALAASDLSPWVTVETFAELEAVAPSITLGVRTIDAKIIATTSIPVPAGERWVMSETAIIASEAIGGGGFVFDVDAPAISGPVSLHRLDITNINVGPSSWCVDIISTLGRITFSVDCTMTGIRGTRCTTVLGLAVIQGGGTLGALVGLQLAGTLGIMTVTHPASGNFQPGGIAIEILGGANLLGTMGFTTPEFSLTSGQFGFAISDAVTVAAGALIQVGGAAVAGASGSLFRQDVGDMSTDDDRLLVYGAPESNWAAVLDASRTDLADPLIVPYPAFPAASPTPIPYWTGAGLKVVVRASAHWDLVLDDPAPGDMYLLYLGVKQSVQELSFQVLVDRNAGTGPIELMYEKNTPPASAVWTVEPTTRVTADNTNAFRQQLSGGGDVSVSPGDRFRPASDNLSDSVDARIYQLKLQAAGL